jgi:ankyrin repeat protein
LTSARLVKKNDTISRFHVSLSQAHTIIAQASLGVLLHLDENITNDGLDDFPLAEYAAEHWVGHARFETVSSKVQDGMKCLFDPNKNHLSVWVWVRDPEYPRHRYRTSERPEKARATPLHYAAFCGIYDAAAFLIVEHSQDVNARGFFADETPLQVASRRGHADVAQLLLEHGADADTQDDKNCTSLVQASKDGHVEVVRLLLEHGADTEARDNDGWSPLDRASKEGHVEVARVLLEHGADVNAKDENNWAPLHNARGEEITRFLIKHGADANALDIKGRCPLNKASEFGRAGNVRALLEHGVDANPRDADNATPLYVASRWGHADVARLLLQYGSDIHARDDVGQTPFMIATENGHGDVMGLLLEHGAEDHRK